ncbi:AbrB/MazE/SpoVT family DNA-binding domain-containing protein [Methanobrevibacter arboriphilus]|nr:AbrB/MazE/SpoVT family DNA-binding domain-containing protein [Methanobrevibacter arboriphilus]
MITTKLYNRYQTVIPSEIRKKFLLIQIQLLNGPLMKKEK